MDILSDCPYPVKVYINNIGSIIIIIFDNEYDIIDCNQYLLNLLEVKKDKIINNQLQEIFSAEDLNFLNLPETEDEYKKNNLEIINFLSEKKINLYFDCYIFNSGNNYFLIGEKSNSENEEVINIISLLNKELSNKTRKLTKQNKKLEIANKKIEKLLKTDDLTGLANRRHFMDYFQKMFSQAERYSHPLSLIMADLDDFKNINDTYGHKAGDDVLQAVGELLRQETRTEDMAARVGGEEFTILLTRTGCQGARKYAERIRKKIASLEIETVPEKITISLGISQKRKEDDPENLFIRTDDALYKAKESGKNRFYQM
ncbi:MAG: GGDEF domain-containing protein [Bacillota bacterium]